ncbi:putative vacuolar protein sorting protein Vps66 [Saccharata proteae CBS 121410]|uniref:Vacuolar protein sorting protein Vps66 n=1 Tax=Saccharata proteae CBS 121410 TaxID=1314787 RepID=A0A9P4LUD1_9PEZI|nr:putative vacuolar protein sorting protein Vps66 [Saccharata proteae CBS 121410]
MEKYSQYRDRGSGIAPFFPVPTQPSGIQLPLHLFLFLFRIPLLLTVSAVYFLLLSWLPVGSLIKKAALWMILGIPGVWWIDLQIDGVKRGSLARQDKMRLPHPGSIIASSFTSPLDSIYLAAIFDPVFTISYPSTRLVQRISLFQALLLAFRQPQEKPPPKAQLTSLAKLVAQNPDTSIVVLPECTTTNGRGILPFSPSLLTASPRTKIFPVSLRYTPGDVTTPIPGSYLRFFWNLCSKPTHCIRVRIAEAAFNNSSSSSAGTTSSTDVRVTEDLRVPYDANYFDKINYGNGGGDGVLNGHDDDDGLAEDERKLLDRVGEDLARLGRVKRVGLGVREKSEFVRAWTKKRR